MLRRTAISLLLGVPRIPEPERGCAVLLDIQTRKLLYSNQQVPDSMAGPPGSSIKPLTLAALLRSGKLQPREKFVCSGQVLIGGRRMDCSHPRMGTALDIETALAYSCNSFVSQAATRFGPGDLSRALTDFTARPVGGERQQLQAIGEEAVVATPVAMATAFRRLALRQAEARLRPVFGGLESAVEYGTAQLARVAWAQVAGKTGTTRAGGQPLAWFAGYAPAAQPKVVVAVMISGRHGATDAAPVAAQILQAWHEGKL